MQIKHKGNGKKKALITSVIIHLPGSERILPETSAIWLLIQHKYSPFLVALKGYAWKSICLYNKCKKIHFIWIFIDCLLFVKPLEARLVDRTHTMNEPFFHGVCRLLREMDIYQRLAQIWLQICSKFHGGIVRAPMRVSSKGTYSREGGQHQENPSQIWTHVPETETSVLPPYSP